MTFRLQTKENSYRTGALIDGPGGSIRSYAVPISTLFVLKIGGRGLRLAIERSASYFALDSEGRFEIFEAFAKSKVEHYNYDFYAGIEYTIDVSRPVRQRVTNLLRRGRPVTGDDEFAICMNNYRASGAGGYDMYTGCILLRETDASVSDLLLKYFESGSMPDPAMGSNYKVIVPERQELVL